MHFRILAVASLCVVGIFCPAIANAANADRATKPNVVFILADDLGWSDTTLYGTTKLYKTPHIERLAARGMLFTNAYSASPLCSPTRASILTGLHPARLGLTSPTCHLPQVILQAEETTNESPNAKSTTPTSVTRLDTKYQTLSRALQSHGYATGHFGKWHLGAEPYSPLEHGFDVDIPHWHGPGPAGSYVAPWKYVDFDPQTPNEHIEDRMAQEAVSFIEAHKSEPFFLNYWMFSVHAPFDAKRDLIEKYRSVVDSKDPQRSPTYAAMIESMDDAVGTLLDALDRLELADNTIIVFASDNGGNMYNEIDNTTPTSNTPLRGGKATMYEGGVRGPAIVAMPDVVQPGVTSNAVIQSPDYYPTLLELLGIEADADQSFDGISIVPALLGGELKRESIFTYFPHAPPVPDWLPNSVSVHHGDWKLIRLFHAGENGDHRYKLFNLAEDIGETNNLAAAEPERVLALDAEIEEFLIDTQAVRPIPNPAFDPTKYQIENEGVGRMKTSKAKPKSQQKPVAGWTPGGTAKLQLKDGALVINSTGGDPYFSRKISALNGNGKVTVSIMMSSIAKGHGQVFWTEQGGPKAFAAERSVKFDVTHDDQWHDYKVFFQPKQPIISIRIDPARSAGTVKLRNVTISDSKGWPLYEWQP